jgi:hypothetical protein
MKSLRKILVGDGKPFEESDGSGYVIEARDDDRHGANLPPPAESAIRLPCGRYGLSPLLIEGKDLQLDREIDLPKTYVGRNVQVGGRKVEDRLDPGVDESLRHLLRLRRRRGDDPYGDPLVGDDVLEVVEMPDLEAPDLRPDDAL